MVNVGITFLIAFVFVVICIFGYAQWRSNRTYRPSKKDVSMILRSSIEGRLSLEAFDEFICVSIAYDKRLDAIRERYNVIINDEANMDSHIEITELNATPLNHGGKEKVRALLDELEKLK